VEIFDTKFLAVRTNESEAIVQNGDFVFLESANSCTVQVGDAVAADTSRGIVIGVIKKVVVSNDETSYVLETNPLEAESYVRVVSAKNIEGKIIKKIGNLGTVLSILKQFNFVFIILGILFFCWSLLDMTKIRKQTFEEICIL